MNNNNLNKVVSYFAGLNPSKVSPKHYAQAQAASAAALAKMEKEENRIAVQRIKRVLELRG